MAFWNAIFLLYGFRVLHTSKLRVALSAILYLLSLVFIFLSLSAAGVAIWLGLNLTIIIPLLWIRVKHVLKKQHYIWLGCLAVAFLFIGVANLNLAFSLLNREANLTGRIPLWSYLIEKAVKPKPFLGNGFSAIWDAAGFKRQTTLDLHWVFTITNGHNGFMDILLGVGVVGLGLSVLLLLLAFYRTGKLFVTKSQVENLLPFLIVVYFLLSNLSISLFLGIESFHWVLLIAAMFIATPLVSDSAQ
jgi:O-antigen ligase